MRIYSIFRNEIVGEQSDLDMICMIHALRPFRDMQTAHKDGSLIEVCHGPQQETAEVYGGGQNQEFVRDDDPHWRTLNWVTGWRPLAQKQAIAAGQL